uniref:Lipocalin n=1 Tax=Rhipicephalus zambeziensis TaxID=60191 RepID=A0A224YBV4_9ACAR
MLAIFVVFVHVLGVFSMEDRSAMHPSSTTQRIKTFDGWDFFQRNRQVDMQLRNFNFSMNGSVVCLSSTRNVSMHASHKMTDNLRYKNNVTGEWRNFTQTYIFYNNSRGYNIMNSSAETASPSVSLEFLLVGYKCAIVKVAFLQNIASGMPDKEAQSFPPNGKKHSMCAILVAHAYVDEPQPYCNREFDSLCGNGTVYAVYDQNECNRTSSKTPHC